jgi:hypothetical protein
LRLAAVQRSLSRFPIRHKVDLESSVNSLPYIHEPNLGTSISVVIIPHSHLGTVPLSASGSPHPHLLLPLFQLRRRPLSCPSTDISEALGHCHCPLPPVLVPRTRLWLVRKLPLMGAKVRSFASIHLRRFSPSPPTCAM